MAATTASFPLACPQASSFLHPPRLSPSPQRTLPLPLAKPTPLHLFLTSSAPPAPSLRPPRSLSSPQLGDPKIFHGQCFVVQDNIDTDQIIPAEYLTLVPSKPDEYEQLGSFAMVGLPAKYGRFIEEGQTKTKYSILIGGANFGCGSSREHAPVALGAAGVRAVVAESYARIFFRNSVATGELYPLETDEGLSKECKTGDYVTVDIGRNSIINHTQNKQYELKPIGDAGPVIDAGGIFAYARKTGMISGSS